ncbi:MAG: IS4 family transposase [Myxococcales bacterium]|nr:IS4 family transposase [Myxococcales bacterium]
MEDIASWARAEVGHAELGDARRTARLRRLLECAAASPGGRVTQVFDDDAEREAAYRFLESKRVAATAILDAHRVALGRRAAMFPYVYVAIDQSAMQVTDRDGDAFGPISGGHTGTGVQAMSALVVAPDGVPLGLSALEMWTRSTERAPDYRHDCRTVDERETRFWLAAAEQTATLMQTAAPQTLPWLQLDRGADSAHVLLDLAKLGVAYTVRASINRRIRTRHGRRYLFDAVRRRPALGSYRLDVRRMGGVIATTIEVRVARVVLDLAVGKRGQAPWHPLEVTLVEAREVGAGAGTDEPILWRLLTNHPTATLDDARAVIAGYTMRWRVEDFHLAWKSGTCRIEDSQLRSLGAFSKWATILATVAVRAQRLKTLARETPEIPALTEFSPDEIDAVLLLRRPKNYTPDVAPTLGQLVRWIADLGGYTGKSSGGPPGVRIISRALIKVEAVALALRTQRERQSSGQ